MPIYAEAYMHESDKTALKALKAIPGFTPLLKAYMNMFSEKDLRIANMANNLRIDEQQLSKYHQMLLPICDKLGIDVPQLYLQLDAMPNAFTFGDTEPFIIITSGLLETFPEELIPTVLAHECGHIACHHVLYHTMGRIVLSETIKGLELGGLLTRAIRKELEKWMRSSELSADRAAVICDGGCEKMIEVCLRLSGFDKDIKGEINVPAYMRQVEEYKQLVKDAKWNRFVQKILFTNLDEEDEKEAQELKIVNTHPDNVVRAYECSAWQNEEQFAKIIQYLDPENDNKELPILYPEKHYEGKPIDEVRTAFEKQGFRQIELLRSIEDRMFAKNGQVLKVTIGDWKEFSVGNWFPEDARVLIEYYQPLSEEEIIAAHPGEVRAPNSAKAYLSKNYEKVIEEFKKAGFTEFETREFKSAKKRWMEEDGDVFRISIDGQSKFEKGDWFKPQSLVSIYYSIFASDKA